MVVVMGVTGMIVRMSAGRSMAMAFVAAAALSLGPGRRHFALP